MAARKTHILEATNRTVRNVAFDGTVLFVTGRKMQLLQLLRNVHSKYWYLSTRLHDVRV
jgi:hypothetical protein